MLMRFVYNNKHKLHTQLLSKNNNNNILPLQKIKTIILFTNPFESHAHVFSTTVVYSQSHICDYLDMRDRISIALFSGGTTIWQKWSDIDSQVLFFFFISFE